MLIAGKREPDPAALRIGFADNFGARLDVAIQEPNT
jgi:hypothetical protein